MQCMDMILKIKHINLFFSNYKWYKISPKFSESDFNEIEKKNIAIIKEMENTKEPILLSDYLE